MPIIRVEMLEGRTPDQRKALSRALTATMQEVLGIQASSIWVVISEIRPENWAISGRSLADRE